MTRLMPVLKKIGLFVVLCMVLTSVLYGCGSGSEQQPADSGSKSESADTNTEKSSDSADADKDKKVRKYALVIKTLNNPNAALMSQGAKDAAKEVGAEVVVMAPEREVDSARQLEICENLITQKIDGLLLMPCGSKELVPAVKKANEAGIPVMNIDTKLDAEAMEEAGAHVETFIGSNNYDAGAIGGEFMAKILNKKGKVAVMEGVPGHESSDVRVKGFEETIAKYPDMEIVAKQPAHWETDKGYSVFQNILQANPDLDGIWCASDLMGLGIAQVIQQEGLEDKVQLVGVDGMVEAIKLIKTGVYDGTVEQSTYMMGYEGIMAAEKFNNGEELEKVVYTPLTLIDSSNVDERLAKEENK